VKPPSGDFAGRFAVGGAGVSCERSCALPPKKVVPWKVSVSYDNAVAAAVVPPKLRAGGVGVSCEGLILPARPRNYGKAVGTGREVSRRRKKGNLRPGATALRVLPWALGLMTSNC